MNSTPTTATAEQISIADKELTATVQSVLLKMADRLEPNLPGIADGARRTVMKVKHRPGKSLGHFAEHAHVKGGTRKHEILLNSDRAQGHFHGKQPGCDAVVTLAHELAHLYAAEHGVKDTDGAVHNAEFGDIAQLTECFVEKDAGGSHCTTRLSRRGQVLFADLVSEMERAFIVHGAATSVAPHAPSSPRSSLTPTPAAPIPSSSPTPARKVDPLMSLVPGNSLVPMPLGGGGAVGGSLTPRQQRAALAAIEQVQLGGAISALTDDMRHRLAMRAMENVAMLSGIEGHYLAVAPLAEARIKAIVDAYTLAASAAIQRFGR
ncbi:hypothetical protein ACL9RL_02550 [Plantibacter sp. Mn2098]|uniref:hypothetical protein n=1 Tax=Plantibacter sp. Mn2098 TaxID=3395266 RepID=UPI003BEB6AD5